jgi:diadenosine tetraphosphate (Ap4A) HIT family hydrolase
MRPDATSPIPSPFLGLPEAEWLCANDLAFSILDSFPVSPGHVLVITRRVVPTYFDCKAAEQAAVMELVGEVKKLLDRRLDPKPDGYNVGFNAGAAAGQTVPHVHVHVIPRYAGDMPDPRGGVRHVIPEKGNYLAGPGTAGSPPAVGADWQSAHAPAAVRSPRPWQVAALASLAHIRDQGYSKALVAVATGLGKTWLAAFDVVAIAKTLGRLPRVLVIAHRAEILAQAEATLRSALAAPALQGQRIHCPRRHPA